ncbi:MAG: T9SS type A sorting domain-containing protein [Bacteroidetes bacterium]|nr:T9SS type A sorting domain-containing protein [Bacteroidota bacterium]
MKNAVILSPFLFILLVSFLDVQNPGKPKSAGAPWGNTGGMGEGTCAKIGCHDDGVINTGPGTFTIDIANGLTSYKANQKYKVTVRLKETGIDKFGFQAVLLKNNDSTNAGLFSLINPIRTQLISPDDTLSMFYGRVYATHTLDGNSEYSPDTGEWTFNWTSPNSDQGNVTLSVTSAASNNNGDLTGENVYSDQITLSYDPTPIGINEQRNNEGAVKVFPNPCNGFLNIEIAGNENIDDVQIRIYNLQGKMVYRQTTNHTTYQFILDGLKNGLYLYEIGSSAEILQRGKLIIQI